MDSWKKILSSAITITGLSNRGLKLQTCAAMDTLESTLQRLLDEAEPSFIELGKLLQNVYYEADNLTEKVLQGAYQHCHTASGKAMQIVNEVTTGALDDLENNRQQIAGELAEIEKAQHDLYDLNRQGNEIGEISVLLKMVGMNIHVESSRSVEAREMFEFFSKELNKLSQKISRLAEDISNDSISAQKKHSEAARAISGGLKVILDNSTNVKKGVENAVLEIQAIMGGSQEAMADVRQATENISSQIGVIMEGLQFHDITKQQMEHIQSGFEDVRASFSNEKEYSQNDAGSAALSLPQIIALLEVQRAQIRDSIAKINDVRHRIASAFQNIIREIDLIERASEGMCGRLFGSNGGKNLFTSLKFRLERLSGLLENGNKIVQISQEAAEVSANVVEKLSGHGRHVRIVNLDLNLKSINAIIKSIHLGKEGRVLEILAQEVTNISDQSNEAVRQLIDKVEIVTEWSRSLKQRRLQLADQNAGTSEKILERTGFGVKEGIRAMEKAINQIQSTSGETMPLFQNLRSKAGIALNQLMFMDNFTRTLETLERELKNLINRMRQKTGGTGPGNALGSRQLAGRYTMEREREIHRQVMDHLHPTGKKTHSKGPNPDSKRENKKEYPAFDDNPSSSPQKKNSSAESRVERTNRLTGSKDHELGDNVDLF